MQTLTQPQPKTFSLDPAMLREILKHAKPLGHHEDAATLNLGFGFLYYGLVRALRPKHVVVVGSGFGFSVVCLALALKDNDEGVLSFVDPSVLKDGPLRTVGGTSQWDDPAQVRTHFRRFGIDQVVTHFKTTSAEFFAGYAGRALPRHSRRDSYLLLHDTNIYIREFLLPIARARIDPDADAALAPATSHQIVICGS